MIAHRVLAQLWASTRSTGMARAGRFNGRDAATNDTMLDEGLACPSTLASHNFQQTLPDLEAANA